MQAGTDTTNEQADFLKICASEDLSRLGLVQSHGCLIGVDGDGYIRVASENAGRYFDADAEALLGGDASAFRLPDGNSISAWVERLSSASDVLNSDICQVDGKTIFELFCHKSGKLDIFEVFTPGVANSQDDADMSANIRSIESCPNFYAGASAVAKAVHNVSGYDRVMVYRFLPDGTGEVISEQRREDLTPFMGLRYPASDIPENARRLYVQSPIRIVVDSRSEPYRILAADDVDCDLGLARLRAVSPYHIEYLNNMGVAATLVTSIVVDGRLWGLVACHHLQAHLPDAETQYRCLLLTKVFADRIRALESADKAALQSDIKNKTVEFLGELSIHQSLWYTSLFGRTSLLRLFDVHGCAVQLEDDTYTIGYCPPIGSIQKIHRHVSSLPKDEENPDSLTMWSSDNIKSVVGDYDGDTAGAAYVRVSVDPKVSLLLFKNELMHEVHWGGNPDKAVSVDEQTMRVSPRQSFDMWVQKIKHTSSSWEESTLELLRGLAMRLRTLPASEFERVMSPSNRDGIRFSEIIANSDTNEVRAVVDDFIPEGIATIAFTNVRSPVFLDGYANTAFCRLFGMQRSDAKELTWTNILNLLGLSNSLDELPSNSENTIELVSPTTGQRIMKARRLDLISRHQLGGGSEGVSVLYLQDETERQRIIDALDASRKQSAANSVFRAEILGGMSHELRTPLNAIIGYADILKLGISNDEAKTAEYADTIAEAGRQMLALVEGLLDIAKIERGMLQIEETTFDLRHEIDVTIRIISEHAEKHSQSITLDYAAGDIQIHGDTKAFRQILLNLLGNAVKFSPPGGEIKVTARRTSMNSLDISVDDAGPGVPPAERRRVFEPFSQVEEVDARSRPGAGLGLSIVKAYTELHGGTVSIGESPMGGASFKVRLPNWRIETG